MRRMHQLLGAWEPSQYFSWLLAVTEEMGADVVEIAPVYNLMLLVNRLDIRKFSLMTLDSKWSAQGPKH